jgi:hypothetical protein
MIDYCELRTLDEFIVNCRHDKIKLVLISRCPEFAGIGLEGESFSRFVDRITLTAFKLWSTHRPNRILRCLLQSDAHLLSSSENLLEARLQAEGLRVSQGVWTPEVVERLAGPAFDALFTPYADALQTLVDQLDPRDQCVCVEPQEQPAAKTRGRRKHTG